VPDAAERARLRRALRAAPGATDREAKGAGEEWRVELPGDDGRAVVTAWRTGRVHAAGRPAAVAAATALVDDRLAIRGRSPDRGSGPREPGLPVPSGPWIGVDESGKGDFFGPLVSAAVWLEPAAGQELAALGVQDSKRLSDARVAALAPEVRARSRSQVTVLDPVAYNAAIAAGKRRGETLNDLLGRTHAGSIRALLDAGLEAEVVIVDRFGDERHVARHLPGVPLVQVPRAEADVAVAAASVLAREVVVDWLDRHGLPRGAGEPVLAAARDLARRGGRDALAAVAKLHFATTEKALAG
jgi:ribonuclease HIII